ncbi:hypothetical protein, conserved [Babesia ovata]|uniref:Extracellular matrix-binding ebh n=1 Tax=Babesia ovata TaxID=189622 RepID=A0A2H6KJJ2_9APIC|nr:uncharacterized protein BOVATA_046500 [Babesia ovata]GBE63157.1 hypothetical protein, conserved [Babesia ovata]
MTEYTKEALKGILTKNDENDFHKVQVAVDSVNRELESCKNYAKQFNEALNIDDKSVNDLIDDLHSPLSLQVKSALRTVKQESERLKTLSEKEKSDLKEMTENIRSALSALKVSVNCKIDEDVKDFIKKLKSHVQPIKEKLEKITTELAQYIIELQSWMESAKKDIDEIRKNQVKNILEQVGDGITSKKLDIKDDAEKLIAHKKMLEKYTSQFTQLAADVDAKMKALAGAFSEIKDETNKNIKGILEHIRGKVARIKGSALGTFYMGVEGIKEAVKKYAEGFKNFDGKVEQWVKDILGTEKGLVKKQIDDYVGKDGNKSQMTAPYKDSTTKKIDTSAINKIASAIRAKLASDVFTDGFPSVNVVDTSTTKSIATNVQQVKAACEKFADSLEGKLRGDGGTTVDYSFFSGMADAIAKQFGILSSSPTDKSQLTPAVQSILNQLAGTARGAAIELHSLVNEQRPLGAQGSIAKELEDTHEKAETLNGHLNAATGVRSGSGSPVNHAEKLDDAIEKLKDTATELSANAIPQKLDAIAEQLKEHLTQLAHAIEETTNVVSAQLVTLRDDKIGKPAIGRPAKENTLQAIHDKLDKLQQGAVSDAVKRTTHLLDQYLAAAEKHYSKQLTEHVNSQVKTATEQLTTHVRKQYINIIKLQLEQFSERVAEQLKGLPQEIKKDADKGFKGFMAKFEKYFITRDKSIKGIKDIKNIFSPTDKSPLSHAAGRFFGCLNRFLHDLKKQTDFESEYEIFKPARDALTKLLGGLADSQHFNHEFSINLQSLNNEISVLHPSEFGDPSTSMLQSLKEGVGALAHELRNAYVSAYTGAQANWDDNTNPKQEKCAKIMLTITPTLYHVLRELRNGLENDWTSHRIYDSTASHHSLHTLFFSANGYDIGRPAASLYGELNHKKGYNGECILNNLNDVRYELFESSIHSLTASDPRSMSADEPAIDVVVDGLIPKLYDWLKKYFEVCHFTHIDSSRLPCSVYEMLSWLCGLQFNSVFDKLKHHIKSEFMVEDKTHPDGKSVKPIDASPSNVTAADVVEALTDVCGDAYPVLTTILGNGHADGRYACEFSNNSLKLYYPTNMITLLCLLFNVIKRLQHQLHFLLEQCRHTTALSGWSDCYYGQSVAGSGWMCNNMRCPNKRCDQAFNQGVNQSATQKANQMVNQTCDQTCNRHPTCGLKSPLQSYLEDGLQGFLPHALSSKGTSYSCSTCSKTLSGTPCKTPMGFNDISTMASHTQIGRHLFTTLHDFCGNKTSVLTRLCNQLNCLLHSAPQTLDQLLAFYFSFFADWNNSGEHRVNAFNEAVNNAHFKSPYYEMNECSELFKNRKHVGAAEPGHGSRYRLYHNTGDLYSLINPDNSCYVESGKCGAYIDSLSQPIYGTFASRNASQYLSTIVYLTETLYGLLCQLCKNCDGNCGTKNQKCRIKGCTKGICSLATQSHIEGSYKHDGPCNSIINCRSTYATLFTYGLTFGNRKHLNGRVGHHDVPKRTCKTLMQQLEIICSDKSVLAKLIHKTIPEFLLAIRWPFMLTLLALWSLSLLYLLHIAVVRLDVLRIRSHLRSPASHRIAAQSLLAAARVKALANVKGKALDDIESRRIQLGQLAGQLSGFIGKSEEVQNALVKGLQSNVNQLDKLLKASCGGEGCNDHRSQINTLNEKLDTLKNHFKEEPNPSENLVEILTMCKLNDPVGPLNELNEEINKKIEKLEKGIEDLKNEQNNDDNNSKNASEIAKLNKDLQSHSASKRSLETLKELCDFAEKFDKKSDNPKKLLENLCTGLEKFLGHKNGNYTGSGIVYSDLDRLCDGVMAFLHGVLETVKDDDNVTKYNDYMNNKLENVLRELTTSIGTGRNGLSASVESVKGWLEGYNDRLKWMIYNVTNDLSTLQEDLLGKYFNKVNASQGLEEQLKEWKGVLSDIDIHLNLTETNCVNMLDRKLRDCVLHEVRPIQKSVQVLKESAGNDDLNIQVKHVDAELAKHKKNVLTRIKVECKDLQEKLRDDFKSIWKDITKLITTRNDHFANMIYAVKTAQDLVNGSLEKFDGTYRDGIIRKFTELKDVVDKFINDSNSTTLQTEFSVVVSRVDGLLGKIQSDLWELRNNIVGEIQHYFGCLNGNVDVKNTSSSGAVRGSTTTQGEIKIGGKSLDKIECLKNTKLKEWFTSAEKKLSDSQAIRNFMKILATLKTTIGGAGKPLIDGIAEDIQNNVIRNLKKSDILTSEVPSLMTHFYTSKKALDLAVTKISTELSSLKNLPHTIMGQQEQSCKLMQQLCDAFERIHKQINEINLAVVGAENVFKETIEALGYAATNAENALKAAITKLQTEINRTANEAFEEITKEVKILFANRNISDLHALKSLVSAQLKEIKSVIRKDRITGPKGLLRLVKISLRSITYQHKTMRPLAVEVKKYFEDLCHYLQSQSDITSKSSDIKSLHASLDDVFDKLLHHQHFHHSVSTAREAFEAALQAFPADTFPDAPKKVLQPLKQGLVKFAQELRKQYVSRYSGAAESFEWTKQNNPPTQETVPSEKAMKCAHILVTILKTLNHDLRELHERCHKTNGQWKENKISLISKSGVYNPLGAFFQNCGYKVSRTESSYEGELRCHKEMRGGDVFGKLVASITDTHNNSHLNACVKEKHHEGQTAKSLFDLFDLLKCLTSHVGEYYQSCHLGLPKSKKHPCSVRDICVWLSGLPHTAVYKTIDGHCQKILNQKDEATGEKPYYNDEVLRSCLQHLHNTIKKACHLAPKLLVSIQGHGSGASHAAYPYACCFENNHGGFYYPGDPSSLLGMLKDMCSRLLRALCFLYQQCRYTASDGNGWRECQYGYRIGTYHWDCDKSSDKSSDNSSTQPKSQAKCQPNSEPNSQPNCLPKSPLQAHLMDGLPGFMPHKFTAVGCQPTCSTCPKGPLVGQCITPMGFADLATAGSITGCGDDLVDVLATLCKNGGSVLCELVHALQCISPSPPKGLAEMLSYYCNIFQKSYGSVYGPNNTVEGAIVKAINDSFPFKNDTWLHQSYQNSKLTDAFNTLYCSDNEHNGAIADDNHHGLHTLSPNPSHDKTKQCAPDSTCAPYLKALCHDACHTYPAKHANLYLSWLCQLAWTFWDLLDQLLKAFSDISCQSYGCLCKCGFGEHGVTEEDTSQAPKASKPSCHCNSIVQCKGPMSVFYQYGFTFGLPKELMGSESMKTCDNFVKQLTRVLTKGYFKELFDEIDNFIWAIRTPFSYLLLALWSLSLLYLLHIAVVRLDVLRIRSHLRSPSSHRIAAQSLLAAARVKALANVKYFSP